MTEENNYPSQNRRQYLEGIAFTANVHMIAHLSETTKSVSDAEPIFPIRRIHKLHRAPCVEPPSPKDVLILVSFLSLTRGYENMNDHLF